MKKALEPLVGVIISIATWETWENILMATLAALFGGFAASVGKKIHSKMYDYYHKKRNAKK